MIITRDIINKKLKFHNIVSIDGKIHFQSHSYRKISRLVDGYKNLFVSLGAQPGHKAILGEHLGLPQIAQVLACAELGINLTIVNKAKNIALETNSIEVDLLGPFNYLCGNSLHSPKIKLLLQHSEHNIDVREEDLDYTENKTIWATPETTFLSCVTSGPRKDARVINHSHEFIAKLIKRNSTMFYGAVATVSNLNHGSSPAAYFLPVLVAENVSDYYYMFSMVGKDTPYLASIFDFLSRQNIKINHIHFPYGDLLDQFLIENPKAEECIVYMLTFIKEEWLKFVENKNIKDIVSFYGTSEVSGPVLVNRATDQGFTENSYKKLDDFYGIDFTEQNILEVTMPIYNRTVFTDDSFEINDDRYTLVTVKFNPRINDLAIEVDRYHNFLEQKYGSDASIVLDNVKNSIYLAIWDKNLDDLAIQDLNKMMKQNSDSLHFISKYDFLDKNNFKNPSMNEINNSMLIKYFREIK